MPEPLRIEPFDEHNQELLGQVHPPNWVNPEPKERYHLVIIGAGTAGLVAAAGAAGLGAKVALIERHLMGGDCLNVGCVPSKGVISAARSWNAAHTSHALFHGPAEDGVGNFMKVMERMRRLRASISPLDGAARFRGLGVDVFFGSGKFIAPDAAEVDGKRLHFRRAIIATGARAALPPIPGLKDIDPLTNETLFSLTELPRRFLVIGAGPIGVEMAQSFARFGSEVTVLDFAPQVLPREDKDAAEIVRKSLEREGVRLLLGVKLTGAVRTSDGKAIWYEQGGQRGEATGDQVLVAAGRAPNVEGLGLETAGIEFDKSGVKVNDRMRTTNKKVFAIGDAASVYKFTHNADFQARRVLGNALFFGLGGGKASDLVIPWCTYTSPEVAHVGLYEAEARKAGCEVETITVPLNEVDRAILEGEDEGFVRVHLKKGSDKILGATIVAAHAGEMIGEVTLAMTAGLGLRSIGNTIHPYPTQAEAIRKAADAHNRTRLTPGARKAFKLFFGVFR